MQQEIEVKFLRVNHDELRKKLQALGATCEHPMRLMRRIMFDYPDKRFQSHDHSQRLRIRDEGDKIAINYKAKNGTNYPYEIEVGIDSFEAMTSLLEAIGLERYSFQESKRETWRHKDIEVVLDEWPWLGTYIEIEGPSEESIKAAAKDLGFNWQDARFGSVDTAYGDQYPGLQKSESIGDVTEVRFDKPIPQFLLDRKPQ
jgi:adenylate cyclase class 2